MTTNGDASTAATRPASGGTVLAVVVLPVVIGIAVWAFLSRSTPIQGTYLGSAEASTMGYVVGTDVQLFVGKPQDTEVPVTMSVAHGVRGDDAAPQRWTCTGSFTLPSGWPSDSPLDAIARMKCTGISGQNGNYPIHLYSGQGSIQLGSDLGGYARLRRK